MTIFHLITCFLLVFSLQNFAHADILIGQTTGVTGTVAANIKESMLGSRLYLDSINEKGGVNGEKIKIITLDDKFDPELAFKNAKQLIENEGVLALFMTRGTPHTKAILPLLNQYGVPLIAPSTGAMIFHNPVQPYVFNVRSTYQYEAEIGINHLAYIGLKNIALLYVDDDFGTDALEGAKKAMTANKLVPILVSKFDRKKPDFTEFAVQVMAKNAQAVMILGSGTAVVQAIKQIKDKKSGAQFITLSNNASEGFVQMLGDNGRGVIVTQVFPKSYNFRFVEEANLLANLKGLNTVSPAMMEGFAAAKVLVESILISGPQPTREKIQKSLENFKYDLGGMVVSYDKKDHTGLVFSDLSIVTFGNRFMR